VRWWKQQARKGALPSTALADDVLNSERGDQMQASYTDSEDFVIIVDDVERFNLLSHRRAVVPFLSYSENSQF